jgi:hypothetical protein
MTKAIGLIRTAPDATHHVAVELNYLADMYLECNDLGEAETAIRESIKLSRPRFPGLLAGNLRGLAEIQCRKGQHREALASAEEARHLDQEQGDSFGVARSEELIERIKIKLE